MATLDITLTQHDVQPRGLFGDEGYHCARCRQDFDAMPLGTPEDATCPGVPVYPFKRQPEGLLSFGEMFAKGMMPTSAPTACMFHPTTGAAIPLYGEVKEVTP